MQALSFTAMNDMIKHINEFWVQEMNVLIIQFVLKMMCEKAVKDIFTTVYLAAMCCTCRKLGRAWEVWGCVSDRSV